MHAGYTNTARYFPHTRILHILSSIHEHTQIKRTFPTSRHFPETLPDTAHKYTHVANYIFYTLNTSHYTLIQIHILSKIIQLIMYDINMQAGQTDTARKCIMYTITRPSIHNCTLHIMPSTHITNILTNLFLLSRS